MLCDGSLSKIASWRPINRGTGERERERERESPSPLVRKEAFSWLGQKYPPPFSVWRRRQPFKRHGGRRRRRCGQLIDRLLKFTKLHSLNPCSLRRPDKTFRRHSSSSSSWSASSSHNSSAFFFGCAKSAREATTSSTINLGAALIGVRAIHHPYRLGILLRFISRFFSEISGV